MRKLIFISISGVLLLFSCKKEEITTPNAGIYRGTFERLVNDSVTNSGVSVISISSSDLTFNSAGDTATGAPVSCYGDFEIVGENEMKFTNNGIVPPSTSDYMILDTIWNYYFNDYRFNIWLRRDSLLFSYRLVRK